MAAQPDTYYVGDYNRSLIEASLDPLVTIGSDGKITDVNSATEKVTGLKRHQLIGTDFCTYFTEPEKAEAGYKQVFRDGFVKDYPLEIRHHDGHITPVLYNATVYKDETGNVTGVFAAARDITERKVYEARLQRLNQLYAALSQTNEAIVRAANEEDLFHQICQIAVENGGMLMAWVGIVDDATKTVKPTIWYGPGSEEYLKGIPISTKADDPYGRGPTGTSIRENRSIWCQDFKHDPMTAPWHERAEKFGWNSSASLPLTKNGIPFGSLTLYSSSLNAFDEEAQRLLLEMTKDINFAMDNFTHAAELKKAEEEIHKSEKRFRQTLDEMFEGCMILGFDWTYLYMNDVAAQHGQNKKENLLGRTILEMYPGVEKSAVFAHYRKCMEERVAQRFEESFTFADGITHWYEFSANPIPEGIFVLSIEITERKKAEEDLQKSERELKEAQRIAKIGNWTWDIATDTIYWSKEYYRIIGLDLSQKPPGYEEHLKAYTPESQARLDAAVKKEMQTGEPYMLDLEFTHPKSGAAHWITARSETIRDAQGKIIGLRGTAQDITDRKELEEKLKSAELRYSKFIETTQEGFGEIDLTGHIIYANPRLCQIFGYGPNEMVGLNVVDDLLFPEDKQKMIERLKIRGEKATMSYDQRMKRKTGEPIWLIISRTQIKNEEGIVTGSFAMMTDITERKKSEKKIEELNEVRNKFIEIISHQLRTPLGAVNWNLEMLLNGEFGKLDPTQEQFLRVTYNASLRTTSRIHDLLTAMDVEEGKVIFEHEEMALDSICAEITRSKMDECKLKEITCTYIPPEKDLPLIKGDPGKIKVVITKLIENAITYTKVGGKISAKLSEVDDHIRFEITDNGIGIPLTEQHRIFSRFFRGSNASVMLTDAFGLGLYLSKHFIEQHKGKIGFISHEGEGSTFWFEIPVK